MADFLLDALPFIGMLLSAACLGYFIIRIVTCIGSEPEPLTKINEEGDPVFLEVKGEKNLYLFLILATIAAYFFLGSAAAGAWEVILWSVSSLNFNLGFLFLLPVIVHGILSLKNLRENEVGGLYFYGHALKNADAGLHFAPFMRLEKGPRDLQKIWAPGKPDDIFWGGEKKPLPPGMVRPILLNTREAEEGEDASLAVQMTVGVAYSLFWRISNFLTYNAHTQSLEESREQLLSISRAILSETVAKLTVNGAIEGQDIINKTLDNEIRRRTEGWGIEVMRANLTDINLSHELAEAMRDRATAAFAAQSRIIAAEAQARETEIIGEAEGKAEQARSSGPLKGRAEGYKAIKEAIGSEDGDKVHERETLRDALGNGRAVYVGGRSGMADLVGMFDFVKNAPKT